MNKNYLTGAVLKQYSSTTPALYFTLSYRHLFDTTISAEEDWESGETKRVTKALGDQGRLNDWFLGVGLSGAFWIGTGEYNRLKRPFLPIISYEMLQFEERGEGHMTHAQQNMFGYGLTFGTRPVQHERVGHTAKQNPKLDIASHLGGNQPEEPTYILTLVLQQTTSKWRSAMWSSISYN